MILTWTIYYFLYKIAYINILINIGQQIFDMNRHCVIYVYRFKPLMYNNTHPIKYMLVK